MIERKQKEIQQHFRGCIQFVFGIFAINKNYSITHLKVEYAILENCSYSLQLCCQVYSVTAETCSSELWSMTHAQCNWSCNVGGIQQTALEVKRHCALRCSLFALFLASSGALGLTFFFFMKDLFKNCTVVILTYVFYFSYKM